MSTFERLRPALLFVGLGDTDEHAHHNDYRAYYEALLRFDTWLGEMNSVAERLRAQGQRVTFFITTDHERADDFANHEDHPEAARTWLVVARDEARARGAMVEQHQLAVVSPTIAAYLGVALPHATERPLSGLSLAPHSAR